MRAVLNFSNHCTMKCEWCYVSFDNIPVCKKTVISIIKRLYDLGFSSITLGGGDPFQNDFIFELIEFAKKCKFFVHIDTNAIMLDESNEILNFLNFNVDLLGLPLDGGSAKVHSRMRSNICHYDVVMRKLSFLSSIRRKVKVNTLVTPVNVLDLRNIAKIISEYSPSRWSLYQFWPIGQAAEANKFNMMPEDVFLGVTTGISQLFCEHEVVVEVTTSESRRCNYPIIRHDGAVFMHSGYPQNLFSLVGSIFDSEIMNKVLAMCIGDRSQVVSRYASPF